MKVDTGAKMTAYIERRMERKNMTTLELATAVGARLGIREGAAYQRLRRAKATNNWTWELAHCALACLGVSVEVG